MTTNRRRLALAIAILLWTAACFWIPSMGKVTATPVVLGSTSEDTTTVYREYFKLPSGSYVDSSTTVVRHSVK